MKVFISYSTGDRETVHTFSHNLNTNRFQCYIAESDIQAGRPLSDKIKTEIDNCDCVLAILTPGGIRSQWVNQELGYAEKSDKIIIPLVESGVRLEGFLEGREYIEFDINNPTDAINNTLEYLHALKIEKDRESAFSWIVLATLTFLALRKPK